MKKSLGKRDEISEVERVLAGRNSGLPLESLREDITPIGQHYLLIHFDIPKVTLDNYTLKICGVKQPAMLRFDDILKRTDTKSVIVTLECAGNGRALMQPRAISVPWDYNGIGTAKWTGVPLKNFLNEAGLLDDTVEILFTGCDAGSQGGQFQYYEMTLPLEDALRDDVIITYKMNDQPLLPQHGHPVRLIVPGWYGLASVKWLVKIEALQKKFNGYQLKSYTLRTKKNPEPAPISIIKVRSLMIPPGIPSFLERKRYLQPGTVELSGRAWTGYKKKVTEVEVSTDDGKTWHAAHLEPPLDSYAWCKWKYMWNASKGETVLCVRAKDDSGELQQDEAEWNEGGFVNNCIHRVPVSVEEYNIDSTLQPN